MEYTPFKKIRNGIFFILIIIPAATKFDFQKCMDLLTSNFIWLIFFPIMIWSLWSVRNYKISIIRDRMRLYKVFGKDIDIEGAQINKIELESNRYGKWNWEMIYIYTDECIYEYSITSFNQNRLIQGLINFSSSNNIILDTSNYETNRFDIL